MSKGIKTLKEAGIQKVYEKTHIPTKHIKALFQDDFGSLNKVQFLGFISILEREYGIELNDLKEKGLEYFKEMTNDEHLESKLFVTTQRKKSYAKLYLFAVFLILAAISCR